MRFIDLTRVPFGPFRLRADSVVALVSPAGDPFQGYYNNQPYNCCIHAGNETFRVKETMDEVVALLQEPVETLLADPVPALTDAMASFQDRHIKPEDARFVREMNKPKKGKKSGGA